MNIFRRLYWTCVWVWVCSVFFSFSFSHSIWLCMFFYTNVFVYLYISVCVCVSVIVYVYVFFAVVCIISHSFDVRVSHHLLSAPYLLLHSCYPMWNGLFKHQWSLSNACRMCCLLTYFGLFSCVRKNASVSGYLFHSIGIIIDLLRSYVYRLVRMIFAQQRSHNLFLSYTFGNQSALGCHFSVLLLVFVPFFFVIKTCAD